jgi:hypothetical protein
MRKYREMNIYFIIQSLIPSRSYVEKYIDHKLSRKGHNSSVSILMSCRLDSWVQFLAGENRLSHLHNVQNSSGAHPAS